MGFMKCSIFVSSLILGCHLSDSGDIDLDQDNDGFIAQEDCDDQNAAIHPNATELCDEVDNDCDGLIDNEDDSLEGGTVVYLDMDGDGYGAEGTGYLSCSSESDNITNGDDCDDTDEFVHPSALEICDGIDSDCDGSPDTNLVSTGNRNYNTITQALQDAPSGALINVCDGEWKENLEISQSVQLVSIGGAEKTIVDGSANGHVLRIMAGDVVIEGLTFANGSSDSGGGIALEGGNLTLRSSIVRDNYADWAGGILVGSKAESLSIESSTIRNNEGLDCCGAMLIESTPVDITDSTISDNLSAQAAGIAVTSTNLVIDNSSIENNTATETAAGIWAYSATVSLVNSSLTGNQADISGGGAYLLYSDFICSGGSLISENAAISTGGGVLLKDSDIQGCSLSNNSADMGGGIGVETYSSSNAQSILDCKMENNTAISWGGGVYTDLSLLYITGSVIDSNDAYYGGGLYVNNSSTTILERTRIISNTAVDTGGGIRLASESVTGINIDLGSDADDNSPNDIAVSGAATTESGWGSSSDFYCTAVDGSYGCSFY